MKNAEHNTVLVIVVFILFTAVLGACAQEESEREVTAKEVPQAVLQAFNQAYPGASVKGYSEEMEDGQTYYEVSCTYEGRKIDALYHPDGSVAAIEEVIPESQLPDAVKQGFASEIKNGTIKLAEKIAKDGKLLYELKAVNNDNGERSELVFSAEGKLVEKEVKKMEEKESEEDNDEEEAEEMHGKASPNVTVPNAVKAAFKAKFPGAEEVEWGMESEKEYEAEFELNEVEMSANFDPTGKWLETETKLSEKKLPALVVATVKKEFPDYDVEKAEKLEKDGEPVVYEIKIEKDEKQVEVTLTMSGELIKKEVQNEGEED
jgi:uncharacterized membrane protein YkoI